MGWFQKKGNQQEKLAGMVGRGPLAIAHKEAWILAADHAMIRGISLVFSFVSAYAIAQVFSPTGADPVRKVVGYLLALGFGVLGYFLSRSIAYRLFMGQRVWAYLPICLVVELVEVFCNYVMGVSEIPHEQWLQAIPLVQRPLITMLAYVVLSIIPAVTLFLAVADMDLERRKQLPREQPKMVATTAQQQAARPGGQPMAAPTYGQGYRGSVQGQGANSPTVPMTRPGVSSVPAPQRGQVGQVGQGVAVPLQGVTS